MGLHSKMVRLRPTGHSDFYTRDGADEAQFGHTFVRLPAGEKQDSHKVILFPPETLWRSS